MEQLSRFLGNRLMSKRRYYMTAALGLLLAVASLASVGICVVFWRQLTWLYRIALIALATLITPTLGDIRGLLLSYQSYKKRWEDTHQDATDHPRE